MDKSHRKSSNPKVSILLIRLMFVNSARWFHKLGKTWFLYFGNRLVSLGLMVSSCNLFVYVWEAENSWLHLSSVPLCIYSLWPHIFQCTMHAAFVKSTVFSREKSASDMRMVVSARQKSRKQHSQEITRWPWDRIHNSTDIFDVFGVIYTHNTMICIPVC